MKKLCGQQTLARRMAVVVGGLLVALAPSTVLAERPEIDCESLSEADQQKFQELSGEFMSLAGDQDFASALTVAEEANRICTNDAYAEYMLGRLYELNGDCASAYYHYEILSNRSDGYKKQNSDVYKEINKNFKNVQKKCGDVVSLEIKCPQPGVRLSITGMPASNYRCPFYGKVKPGSYMAILSKEGFQSKQETINVPETGAVVTTGELRDNSAIGYAKIRCPKSATKFTLINSAGERDVYACPWEGTLPVDTYKVILGENPESTATTFSIAKKDRIEHFIPSVSSGGCTGAPLSNGAGAPAGLIAAALGVLGLCAVRRRRGER